MFLWDWICRDDKMDMMYVEDCCEILDSMRVPIVASEREEGEYPYYGANGIQDYVADYIFDDELVLLAEDGGNFGSRERPIAYRVSGKCWVNNHAHVLKPKDELDVDYLCYSLMFYKVDGMVNGATRQKLTQAAMRKMQIPSRSMDEQKQIVDELNHIMKIKKQRQKELVLLDNLIKARFVEMFDSIKEEKLLGEISEFVTVGIANSATHAYAESGIPMLRNQNIRENYLDDSDLIYIKPEFAAKYESKELKENDIIVMRTGYPGVACLVPKKYEGLINEMIADAWYMVTEYHLRLGPIGSKDNLEEIAKYIHENYHIRSTEKRDKLMEFLQTTEDKNIKKYKLDLIRYVPYKLQVPFYDEIHIDHSTWCGSKEKLTNKINSQKRLMGIS